MLVAEEEGCCPTLVLQNRQATHQLSPLPMGRIYSGMNMAANSFGCFVSTLTSPWDSFCFDSLKPERQHDSVGPSPALLARRTCTQTAGPISPLPGWHTCGGGLAGGQAARRAPPGSCACRVHERESGVSGGGGHVSD